MEKIQGGKNTKTDLYMYILFQIRYLFSLILKDIIVLAWSFIVFSLMNLFALSYACLSIRLHFSFIITLH
jgi:hypothetical protein